MCSVELHFYFRDTGFKQFAGSLDIITNNYRDRLFVAVQLFD